MYHCDRRIGGEAGAADGVKDGLNASALEGLGDLFSDAAEEKLLKEANLKAYEEYNLRRDENRARLEAEMDRPREFSIGHSLRMEWMTSQAKDPECVEILRVLDRPKDPKESAPDRRLAPRITEEYRRAGDGLLEKKSGRRI